MNIYFNEYSGNNDTVLKTNREENNTVQYFVDRMSDTEKSVLCKVGSQICFTDELKLTEQEYCALGNLVCCSMVDRKWTTTSWCGDTKGYSITKRGIDALNIINSKGFVS